VTHAPFQIPHFLLYRVERRHSQRGTDPSLTGTANSPVSTARVAGLVSAAAVGSPSPAPVLPLPRAPLFSSGPLRFGGFPASVFWDTSVASGTYLRPWPIGRRVGVAAPLFPPRGVPDGDPPSSLRLFASNALGPRAPGGLCAPALRAGNGFAVAIAVAARTLGEGDGESGITAGKGEAESTGVGRQLV
jgi:hypothetical protein